MATENSSTTTTPTTTKLVPITIEQFREAIRGLTFAPNLDRAVTWDWMIKAARRGEPHLLLSFLREGGEHLRDLADLLDDALIGKLMRPRNRPKLSERTRAHLHLERYKHERVV